MKSIRRYGTPIATPSEEQPRPPGHTRFVDAVLAEEARIAAERAHVEELFAYLDSVGGKASSKGGPTKPIDNRPMIGPKLRMKR